MRLSIADARVLAACGLLMGLVDLWCHIEEEVVGGFHRLVVRVLRVCDLDMRQRWGWIGVVLAVATQTEALASVPVGEGSRRCTGAPQALLFLY
jgi:hypothetical protein